ncbi:MAG: hypothetical protein PHD97_09455 [Bacteroidales bacterium]|nr:hypothetical protein [Bacteroidales bacterium]
MHVLSYFNKIKILLLLIIIFIISVVIRLPYINNEVKCEEYCYTEKLTIFENMYSYGLGESHFSPIQTYKNKGDKFAAYYKRVEDKNGNNYYVSFPPLSFLFPTIIFKIFHVSPSKFILQVFNLIIHFISAVLVFLIIININDKRKNDSNKISNELFLGAIIAYVFYLFSPVMLFFHTEIFSCETFSRPLWLAGILVAFKIFGQDSRIKKTDLFLISLIIFLLTYSEWLGIFFGATVLIIAFVKRKTNSDYLKLIKYILCSVLLSLTLIVVQYSSISGFHNYIHSLSIRFVERSGYFGEKLSGMNISIFNSHSYRHLFENYNSALFGFGYLTIALVLFLVIIKKIKIKFTLSPINVLLILSVLPTLIHSIIFFNANIIHLECFSRISVPFSILLGVLAYKLFDNYKRSYIKYLMIFLMLLSVCFSKFRFDKYYDEKFNDEFINKTADFIKNNSRSEDVIILNIEAACPAPYLYLIYKTKRNMVSAESCKRANEKFSAILQNNAKYFEIKENPESFYIKNFGK